MANDFDAAAYAKQLRTAAIPEVHQENNPLGPGSTFDLFGKISGDQSRLNAVAAELLKGNSSWSAAPQAEISYYDGAQKDVKCITFKPGPWDSKEPDRQIGLCQLRFELK
jgi:hypothetical protein